MSKHLKPEPIESGEEDESVQSPSSQTFALLKLPKEVMKRVVEGVSPDEMLELAEIREAREAIRALEISPSKGYIVQYQLEFTKISACFQSNKNVRKCVDSDPEEVTNALLHLTSAFPGPISELYVCVSRDSTGPEFVRRFHRMFGGCDDLTLSGLPLEISEAIKLISVRNQLRIVFPKSPSLPNLDCFNGPRLVIEEAFHFRLEQVVIFPAIYVLLRNSLFGVFEVRSLIDKLLDVNSNIVTEWFEIMMSQFTVVLEALLNGQLGAPWDPSSRDAFFSHFQGNKLVDLDCRGGYDTTRVGSDLLVTILAATDYTFHIVVWRNRFPNAQNIARLLELHPEIETQKPDLERSKLEIEENVKIIEEKDKRIKELEVINEDLHEDRLFEEPQEKSMAVVMNPIRKLKQMIDETSFHTVSTP